MCTTTSKRSPRASPPIVGGIIPKDSDTQMPPTASIAALMRGSVIFSNQRSTSWVAVFAP